MEYEEFMGILVEALKNENKTIENRIKEDDEILYGAAEKYVEFPEQEVAEQKSKYDLEKILTYLVLPATLGGVGVAAYCVTGSGTTTLLSMAMGPICNLGLRYISELKESITASKSLLGAICGTIIGTAAYLGFGYLTDRYGVPQPIKVSPEAFKIFLAVGWSPVGALSGHLINDYLYDKK